MFRVGYYTRESIIRKEMVFSDFEEAGKVARSLCENPTVLTESVSIVFTDVVHPYLWKNDESEARQ